jgi:hypothetical protein
MYRGVLPTRHSRAGGNPGVFELDSRLRGNDNHFVTFLKDTTLVGVAIARWVRQINDKGKMWINIPSTHFLYSVWWSICFVAGEC